MRPAFLSTVLSSISLKINCGKYTTFLFVIHLGFVFRKFCVLEDFIGVAPCFYLGVSRNPLSNAARFLLSIQRRIEVSWRPGQESPCSNLRSFGSKLDYSVEESTCNNVGTLRLPPVIRRPERCAPSPPVTPQFQLQVGVTDQHTFAFV